jgi:UDP-sugar diphosphatase
MNFKIENFSVKPLKEGHYIRAFLAEFSLNGQKRDWELIKVGNSVAILIYNQDSDSFVLVKQFRPAVYFNHGGSGVTIELCAGLIDKDLSIEQIASEEIMEECGFRVEPNELKKITSFYTSVGSSGSKQHLFYAEVNESRRVNAGGGVVGEEQIEVIELPVREAKEFMYNEDIIKTPGLLFAFEWFLCNK